MPAVKRSSTRPVSSFHVGGKVIVHIGPSRRTAEIVEDRGYIGVGGRRILRVRYVRPSSEARSTFEVPTTMVSPAPARSVRTSRGKTNTKVA